MGSGFAKKKKQAKMLQQQLLQMQDQMEKSETTGQAANGLVTIVISGDGSLKSIKIKPECVDPEDVEGLEDLIKAAFHDASKKIQDSSPKLPDLSSLAGGSFPDLKGFGL